MTGTHLHAKDLIELISETFLRWPCTACWLLCGVVSLIVLYVVGAS